MILSVKVSVSSVGECEVDSGVRGGEANRDINKELSSLHSLPTPLYHTANTTLFTHSTLKPTLIY